MCPQTILRHVRLSATTLLVLLIMFSNREIHADSLQGRISQVNSGDQILLTDARGSHYRIRLAGIEAPPADTMQGRASRQHLAMLIAGKPVTLEVLKRARGPILWGKVMLGSADINLRQLEQGLARFRPHTDLSLSDQKQYQAAEDSARTRRLGLWQNRAASSSRLH